MQFCMQMHMVMDYIIDNWKSAVMSDKMVVSIVNSCNCLLLMSMSDVDCKELQSFTVWK